MSFNSETSLRVPLMPTDKTPMHQRKLRNLGITSSHFALPHSDSKVSGDLLFELRGTNWQMNMILDISGHGERTEAYAPVVSQMVAETLSEFSTSKPSPAAILQAIEGKLATIHIDPKTLDMMFVSGVCAVFDLENRTLTYANAGHPAPLYYDASKRIKPELRELEDIGDNGRPMMFDGFLPNKFGEKTMGIHNGDLVLLYTDGVFDFFIKQNISPKKLTDAIVATAGKQVSHILAKAEAALQKEAPIEKVRETDDLTLLLLKFV